MFKQLKWVLLTAVVFILSLLVIITMSQCDYHGVRDAGFNNYKLIPMGILLFISVPSLYTVVWQISKILGVSKDTKVGILKALGLSGGIVVVIVFYIINFFSKHLCN